MAEVTKDELIGTVHAIQGEVKSLAKRDELHEVEGKIDRMKGDLTDAIRRIEQQIVAGAQDPEPTGSEWELRYYLSSREEVIASERRSYREAGDDRVIRLVASERNPSAGYGLLDDPQPVHEWQRKLQRAVTARTVVRQILGPDVPSPLADREVRRVLDQAPGFVRKIFTDSANAGAEWIPDVTAPELDRAVSTPLGVAALFGQRQLPASGVLHIPSRSWGLVPYKVGPGVTDTPAQYTASTLSTSETQVSAVGLAVRSVVDDFSQEDAILSAVDLLLEAMADAIRMGEEDGLLNGDTAGTHGDSGLASWNIRSFWAASMGGSSDHRRRYTGLRHRAIDVFSTTDLGSTQTAAGLAGLRADLGARGLGSVAYITSPEFAIRTMMTFDELETLDKAGSMASIIAPEGAVPVAMLYGCPVVLSDFMDVQLNASGIYDNSTKTKTGIICVDRSRFEVCVRRGVTLDRQKDITRQAWDLVATARTTFRTKDGASVKNVSYGYNLTP